MSVRGLGLVALAAAVGLVAGYVYADASLGAPEPSGTPAPVAAAGPAMPTTPHVKTLPDSDLPPLSTDLTMVTAKVGRPGSGVQLPVPDGWPRRPFGVDQAIFSAPGNPDAAYSVRVDPLEVTQSSAQMVAAKMAQLPLDSRISQLKFLEQTDDTLVFTYILFQHRVEQVIRWPSINGGPPIAEIAASGRLVDEPGMRTMTAVMAAGTERQPATPKKSPSSSPSSTPSGQGTPDASSSPSS